MTWPTGLNKVINLAQTIRQTFHQVQAAPVLGEDISGFDEHRDFWRAIHNLNQESQETTAATIRLWSGGPAFARPELLMRSPIVR
jgi:hypothetical protein